jgi:hypothetical protein
LAAERTLIKPQFWGDYRGSGKKKIGFKANFETKVPCHILGRFSAESLFVLLLAGWFYDEKP